MNPKRNLLSKVHPIYYPPVIAGLIVVFSLLIYLFTASVPTINSDAAAPFNLAREMLRTGEIFPDGWVGSTGIFHFNYMIWLCLHIIPDYLLAKSVVEFLYACIFAASIVLLCRWVFRNQSWLLIIPILFTCLSFDPHYEILFVQCAYTNVLFFTFFVMAFFGRSVVDWENWVLDKKWVIFTCIMLFLSCLFGIVLVQSILIPMFGSFVILVLKRHKDNKTWSEFKGVLRYIPYILLLGIAGSVGFLGSMKIYDLSGVVGNNGVTTFISSLDDLILSVASIFQGILCYVQFPSGTSLFSLNGILGLIRVCAVVALTVVFPFFAFRNFKHEPIHKQFFLLFVLLHVAEILVIMALCGPIGAISAGRYLISSIILLMVVGLNYIYETFLLRKNVLGWLYSLGVSMVAVICMLPVWMSYSGYQANLTAATGITDFLQENDLEFGYATFWNAGRNTILSNGEVQISGVIPVNNVVSPYYWLTSKDWYEPDFYTGRSFLMLTSGEIEGYAPNGYEATQLGNPDEILTYGDYTILVYNYNISTNQFIRPLDASKNYIDSMALSDPAMRLADGSVSVASGQVLYGPYIDLKSGNYSLKLEIEGDAALKIMTGAGAEMLHTQNLSSGTTEIPLNLDGDRSAVEFLVETSSEIPVVVKGIYLSQN